MSDFEDNDILFIQDDLDEVQDSQHKCKNCGSKDFKVGDGGATLICRQCNQEL